MKSLLSLFVSTFIFTPVSSFKNEVATTIHPKTFLASLTFDGNSLFDKGETNFPISFSFNTTQDANEDGKVDLEDNLENLVMYSIGETISGIGKSGFTNRGANDQRPAIYFHLDSVGDYQVYEYWLYYADNDWINNHEHDWEKYFVYVKDNSPKFIKLSHHNSFTTYDWKSFPKEDGFPLIGIHRGSHALENRGEDGVKISYNGKITSNNGKLLSGNNQTIPWVIYSNDKNVANAISFSQSTNKFYYGDPIYFWNRNEFGDANNSPWERREWESPPMP